MKNIKFLSILICALAFKMMAQNPETQSLDSFFEPIELHDEVIQDIIPSNSQETSDLQNDTQWKKINLILDQLIQTKESSALQELSIEFLFVILALALPPFVECAGNAYNYKTFSLTSHEGNDNCHTDMRSYHQPLLILRNIAQTSGPMYILIRCIFNLYGLIFKIRKISGNLSEVNKAIANFNLCEDQKMELNEKLTKIKSIFTKIVPTKTTRLARLPLLVLTAFLTSLADSYGNEKSILITRVLDANYTRMGPIITTTKEMDDSRNGEFNNYLKQELSRDLWNIIPWFILNLVLTEGIEFVEKKWFQYKLNQIFKQLTISQPSQQP